MKRWVSEQMSRRMYRHMDRRINGSFVCKMHVVGLEPPCTFPQASNLGMLKDGKVSIALGRKQHCIPKNYLQESGESRIYDYQTMTTELKIKNIV